MDFPERVPLLAYQPLLAKTTGYKDPNNPFRTTLVLSKEAKKAEDGKWAWMDGQEVDYYELVTDGVADLRTLSWDVDWATSSWKKDLPTGPVPVVHDVLYWLISFSHPFIDFSRSQIFNGQPNSILPLLKDPNSFEPVPNSKPVEMYSPTLTGVGAFPWGYGVSKVQPRRLKAEIQKQILDALDVNGPAIWEVLDPHKELGVLFGQLDALSAQDLELVKSGEYPAPITTQQANTHGMVDLPPEQYVAFMTQHAAPGSLNMGLGESRQGYALARIPIPDTFRSTEEIENRLKRHLNLPSDKFKIKYLRRMFLLSVGHFQDAEFSLSYVGGEYLAGRAVRKKAARLRDWRDILQGLDPIIVLGPNEPLPPEYVYQTSLDAKAIMYLGPVWCLESTLEGKVLPTMYFADEDEFIERAVKQLPQTAASYKGGKDLVYVMNGMWCERNGNLSVGGRRGEGGDYHNPAVNCRSLSEWVYGPMAHNMAYTSSTTFKSIEVYHPVGASSVDAALEAYAQTLAQTRAENEKALDPAMLAFINQQVAGQAVAVPTEAKPKTTRKRKAATT